MPILAISKVWTTRPIRGRESRRLVQTNYTRQRVNTPMFVQW